MAESEEKEDVERLDGEGEDRSVVSCSSLSHGWFLTSCQPAREVGSLLEWTKKVRGKFSI